MLLGATTHGDAEPGTESFIIQLILQLRYAEAYELLLNQPVYTATVYNTALCLNWSGNYQEALAKLERIQLSPQLNSAAPLKANSNSKQISDKQNQTDDHLHGISEAYVKSFPALVFDAVIRLKTDCWVKLGDYTKVIALATPIAHKGYKNIAQALKLAATANEQRI